MSWSSSGNTRHALKIQISSVSESVAIISTPLFLWRKRFLHTNSATEMKDNALSIRCLPAGFLENWQMKCAYTVNGIRLASFRLPLRQHAMLASLISACVEEFNLPLHNYLRYTLAAFSLGPNGPRTLNVSSRWKKWNPGIPSSCKELSLIHI